MADDTSWIRKALDQPGKTRKGLASALGIQPSGVTALLKGERRLKADEERRAAAYLNLPPPDWRNQAMPQQATVPVVGVVGLHAAMLPVEYGAHDPGGRVAAPADASASTVAVEIRGAGLGELFDRWLLYYDEGRDPPTAVLLDAVCVVGLADGRVFVRKLRRGSQPHLWDLHANTGELARDQALAWAAKVKQMSPR